MPKARLSPRPTILRPMLTPIGAILADKWGVDTFTLFQRLNGAKHRSAGGEAPARTEHPAQKAA